MLVRKKAKKKSLTKGAEAKLRAIKIAGIRCRRKKQVGKALLLSKALERAVTSLEKDPEALIAFKKRRLESIKKKKAELSSELQSLIRQAQKASGANLTRLIRAENRVEAKLRALKWESKAYGAL